MKLLLNSMLLACLVCIFTNCSDDNEEITKEKYTPKATYEVILANNGTRIEFILHAEDSNAYGWEHTWILPSGERKSATINAKISFDPNSLEALEENDKEIKFIYSLEAKKGDKVIEVNAKISIPLFVTDQKTKINYPLITVGDDQWTTVDFKVSGSAYAASNGKGKMFKFNDCATNMIPGMRIPSKEDWKRLMDAYGGEILCKRTLVAKEGWIDMITNNESGLGLQPNGYTMEGCRPNKGTAGKVAVYWTNTTLPNQIQSYTSGKYTFVIDDVLDHPAGFRANYVRGDLYAAGARLIRKKPTK